MRFMVNRQPGLWSLGFNWTQWGAADYGDAGFYVGINFGPVVWVNEGGGPCLPGHNQEPTLAFVLSRRGLFTAWRRRSCSIPWLASVT